MNLYIRSDRSYVCENCVTEGERAVTTAELADTVRWDMAQSALEDLRHTGDDHGLDFHAVLAYTWPICGRCQRVVAE